MTLVSFSGHRHLLRNVIRTAVSCDCASYFDASVLHCTRVAIPTILNLALYWLLCTVFVLNADIRLCEPGLKPRCRRACLGGAFLLSFTFSFASSSSA